MVWQWLVAVAWGVEWHELHPVEATSTSWLVSNWNRFTENYHPNYVLDDDPATAWVEGEEGDGEGSMLTLAVSQLPRAKQVKLRIRNGYQKSPALLTANAAPREVQIALRDAAGEVATLTETLERRMGWQEVVVPVPGGRGLTHVDLTVRSVHPGRRYKDTCLSDVQVLVDTDVPYRARQEEAQLAAVKAWIAERVQRAAYFASERSDYPFASYSFQHLGSSVPYAESVEREMAPFAAVLQRMQAGDTWYRATAKRRDLQVPDGLDMHTMPFAFEPVRDLLLPHNVAWFQTEDAVGSRTDDSEEELGYRHTFVRSNVRLERPEGSADPRWAQLWETEVEDARALVERRNNVLLGFDEQGRLSHVYRETTGTADDIGLRERSLYELLRDAEGRIERVVGWREHAFGQLDRGGSVSRSRAEWGAR